MTDLERITTAYRRGLRQLAEDLEKGLNPSPEDRGHLELINRLLDSVVEGYGGFYLDRASSLEANTSVMYATSDQENGGVLDVTLRGLLDYGSLTTPQARFLNACLEAKRTVLISGPPATGKSTLLNALVRLIAVDQRIVAVEGGDHLPHLRERAFTVHLSAQPGTAGSDQALQKAAGMRSTWILVGELKGRDGPLFLQSLDGGTAGLATLATPDPEVTLADWTSNDETVRNHLERLSPILVHMERDSSGRPVVKSITEINVEENTLMLTTPGELEEDPS